jgi:hypothetical protein
LTRRRARLGLHRRDSGSDDGQDWSNRGNEDKSDQGLEDSDQANRNNNYQGDEGPKNESGDTSARQGEQRSDIDGKEISGHASDKFDSNGEKNNSDRKENNITGEENDTNGEEVCNYEGDGPLICPL